MTAAGAPAHVVVVGDVVTDVVVVRREPIAHGSDTRSEITMTGGGAGANTAAWLAATGTRVTLCTTVGADDAGTARIAELVAQRVRPVVRRDPDAPTGTVVVITDGHERTMFADRGANLRLRLADVDAALDAAPDATHLHLSGYALLDEASRQAARHALATATARGMSTSVDAASAGPLRQVGTAAFREWVRGTGLLFVNADEALALAGTDLGPVPAPDRRGGAAVTPDHDLGVAVDSGPDLGVADSASDFGPAPDPDRHVGGAVGFGSDLGAAVVMAGGLAAWCGTAVVKLGAGGAVSCSGGEVTSVPAIGTEALDTTGAGDAFAAGYLGAWLAGVPAAEALAAGCAWGARAVARIGARPV